jgi:hypothetical protein
MGPGGPSAHRPLPSPITAPGRALSPPPPANGRRPKARPGFPASPPPNGRRPQGSARLASLHARPMGAVPKVRPGSPASTPLNGRRPQGSALLAGLHARPWPAPSLAPKRPAPSGQRTTLGLSPAPRSTIPILAKNQSRCIITETFPRPRGLPQTRPS